MNREQEIEREILEKQEELRKLKEIRKNSTRSKAVKELEEYSIEDKVKFFDKMHRYAINELGELERGGEYSEDNDNDHYGWEELMKIIARDKKTFWDYYNSLTK